MIECDKNINQKKASNKEALVLTLTIKTSLMKIV